MLASRVRAFSHLAHRLSRAGKQDNHRLSACRECQALHGCSNQECASFHVHPKFTKEASNALSQMREEMRRDEEEAGEGTRQCLAQPARAPVCALEAGSMLLSFVLSFLIRVLATWADRPLRTLPLPSALSA